ncbi:MAG: hypothetical protein JW724_04725 [Candidatus Altiarchaeota archaeon]|nr:hypothetical protein [Candidatus Altiarchaeota archaeon]
MKQKESFVLGIILTILGALLLFDGNIFGITMEKEYIAGCVLTLGFVFMGAASRKEVKWI